MNLFRHLFFSLSACVLASNSNNPSSHNPLSSPSPSPSPTQPLLQRPPNQSRFPRPHVLENRDLLDDFLNQRSTFISGFLIEKVNEYHTAFHYHTLVQDLNDTYFSDMSRASLSQVIPNYIYAYLNDFSDAELAIFVFQLDSLVDHLILRNHQNEYTQQITQILGSRVNIIDYFKKSAFFRKPLLDLVSFCPSLRIQQFMEIKGNESLKRCYDFSVPVFSCVKLAESIGCNHVNPYLSLNLKSLLIGLLSSRLEDPSVSEHDKQHWFLSFSDRIFWMSRVKIATCLVSILRAKRFDELSYIQYFITINDWNTVGVLIPESEVQKLSNEAYKLMKQNPNEPNLQSVLLQNFRNKSSALLSDFSELWEGHGDNLDMTKVSAFFRDLPLESADETQLVSSVLNQPGMILKLSILSGLLLLKPDLPFPLRKNMTSLLSHASQSQPMVELYLKHAMMLPNGAFAGLRVETLRVLCNLMLFMPRNLNLIIQTIPETLPRMHYSKIPQGDFHNVKCETLFKNLCKLIVSHGMEFEAMVEDVAAANAVNLVNNSTLPNEIRVIFLEAFLGLSLAKNEPFPARLRGFVIESTFTFSKTAAHFRGITNVPGPEVLDKRAKEWVVHLGLRFKHIPEVAPVFLWALFPRIMDGPQGANFFLGTYALFLMENLVTPSILSTFAPALFEIASKETLLNFVPSTFSVAPLLSTRSRARLLSLETAVDSKTGLLTKVGSFVILKKTLTNVQQYLNYPFDYFSGKENVSYDPFWISCSIVANFMNLCNKTKPKPVFPRSFVQAILLGENSMYPEFQIDRIRFELEEYIYLTLIPKEHLVHFVNLISLDDQDVAAKEARLLSDLNTLQARKYSIVVKPSFCPISSSNLKPAVTTNPIPSPSPAPLPSPKFVLPPSEKKVEPSMFSFAPASNQANASANERNKNVKKYNAKKVPNRLSEIPISVSTPVDQTKSPVESKEVKKETVQMEVRKEPEVVEVSDVRERSYRLTMKLIRDNVMFFEDGQVLPKALPSEEFVTCITKLLESGYPLPFLTTRKFFSLITTGKGYAEYAESNWKLVKFQGTRPENRLALWKPKKYRLQVLLHKHSPADCLAFKEILEEFDEPFTLRRLQSLIFFSSRMQTHVINVKVVTNSEYYVKNGCLYIPQWKKDVEGFKEGIEKMIIKCSEADLSQPAENIRRIERKERKLKAKEKTQILFKEPTKANDKPSVKQSTTESKKKATISEQKVNTTPDSTIVSKGQEQLESVVLQSESSTVAETLKTESDSAEEKPQIIITKPAIMMYDKEPTSTSKIELNNEPDRFIFPQSFLESKFSLREFVPGSLTLLTFNPTPSSPSPFSPSPISLSPSPLSPPFKIVQGAVNSTPKERQNRTAFHSNEKFAIHKSNKPKCSELVLGSFVTNQSLQGTKKKNQKSQRNQLPSDSSSKVKNNETTERDGSHFLEIEGYQPNDTFAEFCLNSFTTIRNVVTSQNCDQMFAEFSRLFDDGVEYVALDGEMTGLYTKRDEQNHRTWDSKLRDNTNKLINGARKNQMFQLGLTIKTRDGRFSVWSFYLCPKLVRRSFTPDTFEFMFIKHSRVQGTRQEKVDAAISSISEFAKNSIGNVEPFLSILFEKNPTIILFSGYPDLLHLLKTFKRRYWLTHEQLQTNLTFDFYDTKYIAEVVFNTPKISLDSLVSKLYVMSVLNGQHLHDASFDALLTALAYEKLRAIYGEVFFNTMIRKLFKYAK